jgi:hypothetical protein
MLQTETLCFQHSNSTRNTLVTVRSLMGDPHFHFHPMGLGCHGNPLLPSPVSGLGSSRLGLLCFASSSYSEPLPSLFNSDSLLLSLYSSARNLLSSSSTYDSSTQKAAGPSPVHAGLQIIHLNTRLPRHQPLLDQ